MKRFILSRVIYASFTVFLGEFKGITSSLYKSLA